MSPGDGFDPVAFAAAHNASLTEETERKLRHAQRDARLDQICRKVAKESILLASWSKLPVVQLQP